MNHNPAFNVVLLDWEAAAERAGPIREQVFVHEQNVQIVVIYLLLIKLLSSIWCHTPRHTPRGYGYFFGAPSNKLSGLCVLPSFIATKPSTMRCTSSAG